MKANEKTFLRFLEGTDKYFVIPVYQRNYDWKKEHCKQLYDDLIDIAKSKRGHFLGSIVSIYHDDGEDREYLIIDGQQRLTTLSLLLLAMYKIIDNGVLKTDVNQEQIRDEYLLNKYSRGDKKIRLRLIKDDQKAFFALFGSEQEYIQETNITINFSYFYNRILEEEISLDELFYAIKRLMIVEIELKNGEDDPQLIFESLNSTGLDLSEADKVRNFILMKEDSHTQERFYNEYWNIIEKNTKYNLSSFIRDYLTIKERSIPKKSRVYLFFKKYINENSIQIEELLEDLLVFSNYYKRIIEAKDSSDKIAQILHKINRLESAVSYPFIMELLDDNRNGVISEKIVEEILEIIISFVFRRLICEVPTNALNKIFMSLGKEIKRHKDYRENYLEIFKYTLTKKSLSQRFPDDEEFGSKLIQKDIYNLKSKNRMFLLEQLENFKNRERVDIENLLSSNVLTIEHIMPQKLNKQWRDELGEEYEAIHSKYLHTLGNITLTGYNSKMSNRSFREKRDMKNGFKDSRLYLNKDLKDIESWNEKSILNRANRLKKRALKIWQYPKSDYKSDNNSKIFTLLDDDINFSGKKIISFRFGDRKERAVKNWKDFYKSLLNILFDYDEINFKKIIIENQFMNKRNYLENRVRNCIVDEEHINMNLTAESFLTRLRVVVAGLGFELDDIIFTIK